MSGLVWNADERGAQRPPEAQQRAKQEADRRAALAAELPYWREVQRQLGPALETAQAGAAQALAEKDRAWARYVVRYHALQGGRTPTGPGGETVILTPMEGMHPEALARWPGRAEYAAFQKAEAALGEATARALQLERDRATVADNVVRCEQAALAPR